MSAMWSTVLATGGEAPGAARRPARPRAGARGEHSGGGAGDPRRKRGAAAATVGCRNVSLLICGSIATDHLMTFGGRFRDSLVVEQLDKLSVSFLVDKLEIRRGGVAPNMCFGLGMLGLSPVLVGAAGDDFADYRSWLERHGVDTGGVRVSELRHTARFVCTTDTDHNQIASFYAGAMSEAREIELAPLGGLDLVVVSPND